MQTQALSLVLFLVAPALLAQPPASFPTHSPQASAQNTDADALKLLQEVTRKYAKATRSHIEAVTETRHSGDLDSFWRKDFTIEYEAPGNRYVFGGRNSSGQGLVVSDGTTEWELHAAYGEYIKRPAGTFGHPFGNNADAIQREGPKEREAYFMRRNLGLLGDHLNAAHFHPEETIQVGDRKVRCVVVGFNYPQDYPMSPHEPGNSTYNEKVWIDKARMLIVRTEITSDYRTLGTIGKVGASRGVTTVDYPVVSLDDPIPEDAFKFVPPPEAKLVDDFTDQAAAYRKAAGLPEPTASVQRAQPAPPPPNYVGTAVPDLTLFAADGRSLDLRTLRGKSVLIDLWATWCGPCLLEMPVIDRIYRFGKPAGLVVVGLDQDKIPADALNYLKKNAYGWDDYSDYHDGKYVSVSLHPGGLPTLILIDADGKIIYFHAGADDDPGLVAAVRKLGPALAAAMDQAEK